MGECGKENRKEMTTEGRKKSILIVHNYYQIPGGADVVVENEKRLLEKHGHKVILYSRNNSEIIHMGKIKKFLFPFFTIFNPKTFINVKRIVKLEHIDIVHVHNTLPLISPSVYYAARAMKIPVIQTVHNFRLLCPGATFYRDGHICEDCVSKGLGCAIKYSCYRNSRFQTLACVINTEIHRFTGIYGKINYICLTHFNRNKLLQLKQVKADKVFVKPNFTYDSLDFQKELKSFYLYIGRMEDIKGVPVILEAFKNMPDKLLLLAGTGSKLEKYEKQAYSFPNIKFLGFVQRKGLQSLLSRAKAVIVASQWYETFGMVVVEAFSSHVPVIVGDIGNIANLVDDGIDGVKFKYDSYSDLIKAVERFESLNRKILGENAFMKYKNLFNEDSNYKILSEIYLNVSYGNKSRHINNNKWGRVKLCFSSYKRAIPPMFFAVFLHRKKQEVA